MLIAPQVHDSPPYSTITCLILKHIAPPPQARFAPAQIKEDDHTARWGARQEIRGNPVVL